MKKMVMIFIGILPILAGVPYQRETEIMPIKQMQIATRMGLDGNKGIESSKGIKINKGIESSKGTKISKESEVSKGTNISKEAESSEETESSKETERETETNSEVESESEGEERKIIEVVKVTVDYPKAKRQFDDSTVVALKVETKQNMEGDVQVIATGTAEQSHVGVWQVQPEYTLVGADAAEFQLDYGEVETEELKVEIEPRVLRIEIADAAKEYYSEAKLANLKFSKKERIKVSGFMREGKETRVPPSGFTAPDLEIDKKVLSKESLLYDEQGNLACYQGALVVKTKKDGTVTGNQTKNYCYNLSSKKDYQKGAISMEKRKGAVDYQYQILTGGGTDDGIWFRKDSILAFISAEDSGYNQRTVTEPLTKSGSYYFVFQYVDKLGRVRAESEQQIFEYHIDDQAPINEVYLNGTSDFAGYHNEDVALNIKAKDEASGIGQQTYYIFSAMESKENSMAAYRSGKWQEIENDSAIKWTKEGTWILGFRSEDLVGNESFVFSAPFIVDKTAPEVVISGVIDGATTNEKIMPTIKFADDYLAEETIQVQVRGRRGGIFAYSLDIGHTPEQIVWTLSGFEEEILYDDYYQLEVMAEDLAGNRTSKEISFTLNRFGSSFQVAKETLEQVEKYYLNREFDIVISEQNLDWLLRQQLVCSLDEQVKILKEGEDYEFIQIERQNGWKDYTYKIPAQYFTREGHYRLSLQSEDVAGNITPLYETTQIIDFVIDKTPPSCILSGIETGGIYDEKEKELQIQAGENYQLETMQLYLNGELVQETAETEMTYTIHQSNDWQTLSVYAKDTAGNEYEGEEISVWVGEGKELEKLNTIGKTQKVETVEKISEHDMGNDTIERQPYSGYIYGLVFLAGGILVTGFSVAVIMKKKNK